MWMRTCHSYNHSTISLTTNLQHPLCRILNQRQNKLIKYHLFTKYSNMHRFSLSNIMSTIQLASDHQTNPSKYFLSTYQRHHFMASRTGWIKSQQGSRHRGKKKSNKNYFNWQHKNTKTRHEQTNLTCHNSNMEATMTTSSNIELSPVPFKIPQIHSFPSHSIEDRCWT